MNIEKIKEELKTSEAPLKTNTALLLAILETLERIEKQQTDNFVGQSPAVKTEKNFHYVDYGLISDEILFVLTKNRVTVGLLENVFQSVREKVGLYTPVQNYREPQN